MALEIERKYLTKSLEWKHLGTRKFYRQGYLMISKDLTIRIRTIEKKSFVTIKGNRNGISRTEFEYQIPFKDATEMLNKMCEKPIIEKYRTSIKINDLVWEVDEFIGENNGLVVAEVELTDEDQVISLPNWIGQEVTSELRYTNSYLVKHPFKDW